VYLHNSEYGLDDDDDDDDDAAAAAAALVVVVCLLVCLLLLLLTAIRLSVFKITRRWLCNFLCKIHITTKSEMHVALPFISVIL
jgi:hypothetical protein